ncbi:MAG TPA: hypothetical protein VLU99_02270 [Nitrososphaerales archaeon]|nr:hypothetical protein [Nitrososphaerales archaeon]HUK74590.1 hypothetical protein [Nitrososphaerales archaeon]
MKNTSSNARAATKTRPPAERADEVVLGKEVLERLKSWCYV